MFKATRYRVNVPDVVSETIDGESVIINLSTGSYYSLNSAGADIWNLLEVNMNFQTLVQQLMKRYSGDATTIQASVEQLIEQLKQEHLIVSVAEASITEASAASDPDRQVMSVAATEKRPFEIPVLQKFSDMEDLLLLDPIHEVDETAGWPNQKTA